MAYHTLPCSFRHGFVKLGLNSRDAFDFMVLNYNVMSPILARMLKEETFHCRVHEPIAPTDGLTETKFDQTRQNWMRFWQQRDMFGCKIGKRDNFLY